MAARKNFAFISYNHRDVKWAKWLQGKLEGYKLPTEIHNEFEDSRYIRPVFRDQTDLNTGVLGNVLRDQLEASQFLIVICSPWSAQSEWVSREVQSFIEWGRIDRIIPVIVDEQRMSSSVCSIECFPTSLRRYTATHPEDELLGISIAEVGKEKAFVRVVSKMLDVSFDTLWQRHERERRRRIILTSITTPVVLMLLYWFVMPLSLSVNLKDCANNMLPHGTSNDGVMGVLTVDGTDHFLTSLDTTVHVSVLPGYYRGRSVPVEFQAYYYDTLRVEAATGFGISNSIDLDLRRDDTFAVFAGKVIDSATGKAVEGAEVSIDGGLYKAVTDAEGRFSIDIAPRDQSETKDVTITIGDRKETLHEEWVDQDVTLLF